MGQCKKNIELRNRFLSTYKSHPKQQQQPPRETLNQPKQATVKTQTLLKQTKEEQKETKQQPNQTWKQNEIFSFLLSFFGKIYRRMEQMVQKKNARGRDIGRHLSTNARIVSTLEKKQNKRLFL